MNPRNLRLVTHTLCPYVQRSIITLEEKGIPYTRIDIDLANKPAWFEQKSPLGKVPVLLVGDTSALFESAVICEYLDEITPGSLHPLDSLAKAYHRAWIEFGSSILADIARLYTAKTASEFDAVHGAIQRKFCLVEGQLQGYPYFSGANFALIDAVYGPIFRYFDVFDSLVPLNTFANSPRCQLWRTALRQRPSVQKAVSTAYSTQLIKFLVERDSYISELIPAPVVVCQH